MENEYKIQFDRVLESHRAAIELHDYRAVMRSLFLLGRLIEEEEAISQGYQISDERSKAFDDILRSLILVYSQGGLLNTSFFTTNIYQTYQQFLDSPEYVPIAARHANELILTFFEHTGYQSEPKVESVLLGEYQYLPVHAAIYRNKKLIIQFTLSENMVFKTLLESQNQSVSAKQFRSIYTSDPWNNETLRAHIKSLRLKLFELQSTLQIRTDRSSGYYLEIIESTHMSQSRD